MYITKKFIFLYLFIGSFFLKSMELPKLQTGSPKESSTILPSINTNSLPIIIKLATILKLIEITKAHERENSIIFYEKFEEKVEDVIAGYQPGNGIHSNPELLNLLIVINSLHNFHLDEFFAKYVANCLKKESPFVYSLLCQNEDLETLRNSLKELKFGTFTPGQERLILMYIDNTEKTFAIKTRTGNSYKVTGSDKKKLKFLKKKLETLTGIPADRQFFFYKEDYMLDEEKEISDFNFNSSPENTELFLGIKANILGEDARQESAEIAKNRSHKTKCLNKGDLIIINSNSGQLYARIVSTEAKSPQFFRESGEKNNRSSLITIEVQNGKIKDIQVEDIVGPLISKDEPIES